MEILLNPESIEPFEEVHLANSLIGICSNCDNNTFCTWVENNKNHCEEYE
ncbi:MULTISPECIES: hypothetical protein [Flavobacterium]|uniref:Uncharacterized protein n=1 Tax=Flavobacterium jumunjinense TaxID=998845 RepID=A0ABV5GNA4_9FLAO|nr:MULTISPECIES: hypothetical protein [Flavobacterium]